MAATLPRVAVLGASGFAGGEVLRLLSAHPGVTVAHASSERWAGYPARAVLPALRHVPALRQLRLKPLAELPSVDLAIACLPAGELPPRLGSVAAQAPMVLNMAGDYRLTDPAQVAAYYPTTLDHPLPAAGQPRYHVPEFTPPDSASGVYNLPGCMASAVVYGLLPAVRAQLVAGPVIADVKTGSSGSGREGGEHPAERSGNFRVRHLSGHRHEPEIRMALQRFGGGCPELTFTVHSIEAARGIFATLYVPLRPDTNKAHVRQAYTSVYRKAPFVHVLGDRVQPMLKALLGSNHAEIGLDVRPRQCVVTVALDNLVKGAAGQAVQTMNMLLGYSETEGLATGGIWP